MNTDSVATSAGQRVRHQPASDQLTISSLDGDRPSTVAGLVFERPVYATAGRRNCLAAVSAQKPDLVQQTFEQQLRHGVNVSKSNFT